jgi:hypothetical protein
MVPAHTLQIAAPAYNGSMKIALKAASLRLRRMNHLAGPARLVMVIAAGLLPVTPNWAQAPSAQAAPTAASPTGATGIAPPKRLLDAETQQGAADPTGNGQAIQRIRTEDAGSRIDELRVGGETQQITVQPKTTVPSYEVRPAEGARGSAPAKSSNETNGSRVWNVFKF